MEIVAKRPFDYLFGGIVIGCQKIRPGLKKGQRPILWLTCYSAFNLFGSTSVIPLSVQLEARLHFGPTRRDCALSYCLVDKFICNTGPSVPPFSSG